MANGRTINEAQQIASEIAREYKNFECVECCMEIARAISPCADVEIVKLCTSDHSDPVALVDDKLISRSGHHVGVRIGSRIYDNHFHDGVAANRWARQFVDMLGNPLVVYRRPLADFFGKIFRHKEFDGFCSSRHQD